MRDNDRHDDRHPDSDDDPTRALDDFVRRMRQSASPPPPTPDLSDLGARLHPPAAPARPRGGVLRSGQRWDAADVEDVPVVELPRSAPADATIPQVTLPPVDLQAEQLLSAQQPEVDLPPVQDAALPDGEDLAAATRAARDVAASQWDTDTLAAGQPVWQPDPTALQLRPTADPRLPAHWQPGAWVGALRLVFDSATEFTTTASGPAVETYPPHRLLLLWPPQGQPGMPLRWPQQALLLGGPADAAARAGLAGLPEGAVLWLLPEGADVDWALGAELVLHHTPALRPYQIDGLRSFIASEREAVFARLNAGYQQSAAGGPVVRR